MSSLLSTIPYQVQLQMCFAFSNPTLVCLDSISIFLAVYLSLFLPLVLFLFLFELVRVSYLQLSPAFDFLHIEVDHFEAGGGDT